MRNGVYRVWLTGPQGRETGAMVLKDGVLFAVDRFYAYNGSYREQGKRLSGEITAKRLVPDEMAANLPDLDSIHITMTGKSGSDIAKLDGAIDDMPGVHLTYELAYLCEA